MICYSSVWQVAQSALKLRVMGHTDNQGALESDVALSKRRAEAVATTPASNYGVAANRLSAFGVADLAPLASNTGDEGRAKTGGWNWCRNKVCAVALPGGWQSMPLCCAWVTPRQRACFIRQTFRTIYQVARSGLLKIDYSKGGAIYQATRGDRSGLLLPGSIKRSV